MTRKLINFAVVSRFFDKERSLSLYSASTGKCLIVLVKLLFIAILLILAVSACGNDKPEIEQSTYSDWKVLSLDRFRLHVSPDSRWVDDAEELARGYNRYLVELCDILEMPLPEDTIDLYVYAPLEIQEVTGEIEPFHTENAVHWAGRTPYGHELTKFLLAKRGIKKGQFHVINEGVPHLLDYSSLNYHDKLNRLNNSGMFVDISVLGDNLKYDSLDYVIRRTESASLCGFIMYNYGLNRLLMLWNSSVDWRRSIETIFQLPIDDFQNNWLDFSRQYATDPDGTVEDDTTSMFRTILQ